jgi:hypothetical protein
MRYSGGKVASLREQAAIDEFCWTSAELANRNERSLGRDAGRQRREQTVSGLRNGRHLGVPITIRLSPISILLQRLRSRLKPQKLTEAACRAGHG